MNFLDGIYQVSNYAFAFVVMLGVLIFVHELGHFLAAKACGVRVLKFSLGFGSPVGIGRFRMRWVRGHTEYVVCWIPLGGFVKMLGETPDPEVAPELAAHPDETLDAKPLWQKLIVIFAGPAMNLLLPVVIYTGILAVGLPQAEAVVGEVEANSPAAVAGLQPNDRVIAIGGTPVRWWTQIYDALAEQPSGEIAIRYERDGAEEVARVSIESREQSDVFGDTIDVGWVGLYHRRPQAMVALADRARPAHQAGLRTGDRVTEVAGVPVADWYAFADAYAAAGRNGEVSITLTRGRETPEEIELQIPALGDLERLGVIRADVLIVDVGEDSPAAEVGLRSGDLIQGVDGEPAHSFDSFANRVRTGGGQSLALSILRDGEPLEFSVTPALVQTDVTGYGVERPRYQIGIMGNNLLAVPGSIVLEQVLNPLVAVPKATAMTVEITKLFMRGLGKLVTGDVPRNQLSGPIGIAEIAGKSLERGWLHYLQTLILISINLGILNLLPIPLLDGGQAVVFLIEGIRRERLSLRTREFVQQAGFMMLIAIMGLAFWNDISRNWSRVVDWLTGGL
ncbi:MAG: RIP metalloprotease RseP [Deltaproteobacteria bacterium]|nr:RIP metalloprotease RseP [Deltaproteobacteria bacterium]